MDIEGTASDLNNEFDDDPEMMIHVKTSDDVDVKPIIIDGINFGNNSSAQQMHMSVTNSGQELENMQLDKDSSMSQYHITSSSSGTNIFSNTTYSLSHTITSGNETSLVSSQSDSNISMNYNEIMGHFKVESI